MCDRSNLRKPPHRHVNMRAPPPVPVGCMLRASPKLLISRRLNPWAPGGLAKVRRTSDRPPVRGPSAATVATMQLYERLQALHLGASRRRLKQWLAASRVRVNGTVVRRGDVAIGVDDHVELTAAPPPACPQPLGLVHEDADILVVTKPPGL